MSAFLIGELQRARPYLEVTEDGCDILHVRVGRGADAQMVYIYLIESPIWVDSICNIVETNTASGVHSLFILWGELLLPTDGARYVPDDWMALFLALGEDKIYAFDPLAEGAYIFPVFFEGAGAERTVRYGSAINAARLNCTTIHTRSPHLRGDWRMADFETERYDAARGKSVAQVDRLRPHFEALRLGDYTSQTLTRDLLRTAYRRMAREFHPDLNPGADTTGQMQRVNDAYERLMREIGA